MTKFTNRNPIKELTNEDVINDLTAIGITVERCIVENDEVILLWTKETNRDTDVKTRYPELG